MRCRNRGARTVHLACGSFHFFRLNLKSGSGYAETLPARWHDDIRGDVCQRCRAQEPHIQADFAPEELQGVGHAASTSHGQSPQHGAAHEHRPGSQSEALRRVQGRSCVRCTSRRMVVQSPAFQPKKSILPLLHRSLAGRPRPPARARFSRAPPLAPRRPRGAARPRRRARHRAAGRHGWRR